MHTYDEPSGKLAVLNFWLHVRADDRFVFCRSTDLVEQFVERRNVFAVGKIK